MIKKKKKYVSNKSGAHTRTRMHVRTHIELYTFSYKTI